MTRFLLFLSMIPLYAFAGEKLAVPPSVALGGLLVVIGLFFWGIYKAVRTQNKQYAWALLPFVLLLFIMFFI